MNAPIEFAMQLKRREYIALLDHAIAIAEELTKQLECIDQILQEEHSIPLAA